MRMIRLQRAEDFQARSRKPVMVPTGDTGGEDTAEGHSGCKGKGVTGRGPHLGQEHEPGIPA